MRSQEKTEGVASLDFETTQKGELRLKLTGRLDADATSRLWPQAVKKVNAFKPKMLALDASGVDYCDGAGAALLVELKRRQQDNDRKIEIVGLKPEFLKLINLFDPGKLAEAEPKPAPFRQIAVQIGQGIISVRSELHAIVSFTGEVSVKLLHTAFHPHRLRWKDTFLLIEKSGANAIGIIGLLGFLIGLILAFQSVVGMAKFGAEIYTADLVVLSLFRELGPLITAIVLASRSGSAFAAELGTMKVNEEVDALTTMGLDPVSFLVVPRVLAGAFVMPLLTMFNLLLGLIGCGLVMASIGYPPVTYLQRIQEAATLADFFSGFVKTFIFGGVIGSIGCLSGLQTGTGASAVGDSATRAVVDSIVAIVVIDGVFAVVYTILGI